MGMSNEILLEMKEISKSFGLVKTLEGVDFCLRRGEIHALVGANGAGKSTLMKILMGIVKKDSGAIFLEGRQIDPKSPQQAAALGIASVFQELSQIPQLTVAENIFLCKEARKAGILTDKRKMVGEAQRIIRQYGIEIRPTDVLEHLSQASRQMAEIVKAIIAKPKLIIMDEPTSSLTQAETKILFSIISDLKQQGTSFIYITHRMDEIFQIADRVTVLRDGRFISESRVSETDFNTLVKQMVGRELELYNGAEKTRAPGGSAEMALEVKGLCKKGMFRDISFFVRKGEILGIGGLTGSGRTELMNLIFGVSKADGGTITLNGKPIRVRSVREAMGHGIAMVPESRRRQGLILSHSISQNIALPNISKFSRFGLTNPKKISAFAEEKVKEYGIKTDDSSKLVSYLSGGNQQKVVLAKWLSTKPRLLIVDEPTVGIDIHSKAEIYEMLRKLADEGVPVILITSDMPELLSNSDRILVMNDGKILGELTDPTQEEIMTMIMKDKGKIAEVV